jgi:hypothetical protein
MGKYNCNKTVFKEIKSEEDAYWLGFILADGHNHQNKTLRVDIKDEGHLNKLSKLIYPDGDKPIKTRDLGFGTIYYFHCGVSEVVRNLSYHGIVPNKSKIATLPSIPNEMYRHFIRGLFDGDGCLTFSLDRNYRRYTFSIVGNEELMIGVKNIVKNQIGIDLGFGKMKMIHYIYKRGNQQIMTLLNWLYDDSTVFLNRKNKKFNEMLEYYGNKKK